MLLLKAIKRKFYGEIPISKKRSQSKFEGIWNDWKLRIPETTIFCLSLFI